MNLRPRTVAAVSAAMLFLAGCAPLYPSAVEPVVVAPAPPQVPAHPPSQPHRAGEPVPTLPGRAEITPAPVGAPAPTAAPQATGAAQPQPPAAAQHPPITLQVPTTQAAPQPGAPVLHPDGVYLPPTADPSRPLTVLLALHGQHGSGPGVARRMRACADQHGWLLVAPSFAYRDYMDPDQVRLDGQQNLPWLHALLQSLPPQVSGARVAKKVLVYGFSRGGQTGHRFALFYPRQVAAVATLSAGSYTLPRRSATPQGQQEQRLAYPFGVADLERYAGEPFDPDALRRVPFWVGVGAADTAAGETPRPWDAYEGRTRVERAQAFSKQLEAMGASVSLHQFSGAGHEETAAMRDSACAFLAQHAGR